MKLFCYQFYSLVLVEVFDYVRHTCGLAFSSIEIPPPKKKNVGQF